MLTALLPYERTLAECVAAAAVGQGLHVLQGDVAWPALVTFAVRHGVAQPVAAALLGDHRTSIPAEVRPILERLIEGNRRRNLAIFDEIEVLLGVLGGTGIDALMLKGPALSVDVYPDFALRNFADVDILVHETDFDRARALLLSAGWALFGDPEPGHHHTMYVRSLDRDILTETVCPEYDPTLTPEILAPHTHRLRLEVHRSPFYDISGSAISADLEPFWGAPRRLQFPSGGQFLAPSPEAMLVHLCSHAAAHVFQKAQFSLDVALVIRRHGHKLDAAGIAALANRYGATAHVRRMLEFVDREFAMAQARQLLLAVDGLAVQPLEWTEIFAGQHAEKSENRLKQWLMAGSGRERLQGAARMIFPTPAAMRRVYGVDHPAAVAALYFWRPFQLAGRLIKIIARRALLAARRPQKERPCPGSEPSSP